MRHLLFLIVFIPSFVFAQKINFGTCLLDGERDYETIANCTGDITIDIECWPCADRPEPENPVYLKATLITGIENSEVLKFDVNSGTIDGNWIKDLLKSMEDTSYIPAGVNLMVDLGNTNRTQILSLPIQYKGTKTMMYGIDQLTSDRDRAMEMFKASRVSEVMMKHLNMNILLLDGDTAEFIKVFKPGTSRVDESSPRSKAILKWMDDGKGDYINQYHKIYIDFKNRKGQAGVIKGELSAVISPMKKIAQSKYDFAKGYPAEFSQSMTILSQALEGKHSKGEIKGMTYLSKYFDKVQTPSATLTAFRKKYKI